MRHSRFILLAMCLLLVISISVPGVFATWQYLKEPEPMERNMTTTMGDFRYGLLYITSVKVVDGDYNTASVSKTADLDISAGITLNSTTTSSVVVEVTLYNSTDVSYYYKETQAKTWDNDTIAFEADVSDLTASELNGQEIREVPSKTFKTIRVTIAYEGNSVSDPELAGDLHFNFVVDKNDIGGIVAQTAVDRFRDILNNKVEPDSYQTLEDAMNNRSGYNKSSAVTYIGNVYGSSSTDSQTVENLFGEEFMSMDLDGDGKKEPITMMIKRLNLDNDVSTGDGYIYTTTSGWFNPTIEEHPVYGAEMTLYITAQDLTKVTNGQDVVVYAATFTKLPGATEWTELVPLTKGKADANNYNGYGNANSFNTDTWISDDEKTIGALVSEAVKANKQN